MDDRRPKAPCFCDNGSPQRPGRKRFDMAQSEMEIIINGFPEKMPAGITISGVMERIREKDAHVIVELNRKVIFPRRYGDTVVHHGDMLEFINPDFGG
jgi:thiamine biosynthesis protein ThiS